MVMNILIILFYVLEHMLFLKADTFLNQNHFLVNISVVFMAKNISPTTLICSIFRVFCYLLMFLFSSLHSAYYCLYLSQNQICRRDVLHDVVHQLKNTISVVTPKYGKGNNKQTIFFQI